jgi:hypothetical protein
MNHLDRPKQIATILRTIGSGIHPEMGAELERYITELEAKQPNRPTQVAEILETISSQYPAEMQSALEAYIANLEAKQQSGLLASNHAALRDPNNPPVWSHQRTVQREQHRRERALKKQNNTW